MMKLALEVVRLKVVYLCFAILKRIGSKELLAVNKVLAAELAQKLSIHQVQQILSKEGIAHCSACTRRFGLKRVEGRLFCPECTDRMSGKAPILNGNQMAEAPHGRT